MKRFLALALCATVLATPAFAQYYGGPPPGYGRGGYDYDEDFGPRRRPPPRDRWEDRDRDRGYDRRGYGPPRGRAGGICVTSRGSCPTPPVPRGVPCRCDIPGFGMKRGNVQ